MRSEKYRNTIWQAKDSNGMVRRLSRWLVGFFGVCAAFIAFSVLAEPVGEMPHTGDLGDVALDVASPQASSPFVSTYRLGAGDVLSIRIFGEPDLSLTSTRLSDAGTVFLPAIGEVSISGKSLGEIEQLVADKLRGRILVNPRVNVSIEQYRPFFINGMVRSPGAYPYLPGLNIRKATSLAGGLLERASLSKIFVIRANDPSQSSRRVELNSPVYPGDVVTIEESFF